MYFQSIKRNSDFWVNKLDAIADATRLHSILVMASLPANMKVVIANHQPFYSINDKGPKSVQTDCHELYCERVVNTKEQLLINDAALDSEWSGNEDLLKFGLGTYLGLPLIVDGVVIGTVCALHKERFDFYAGVPNAYQRLLDLKMEIEGKIISTILSLPQDVYRAQ